MIWLYVGKFVNQGRSVFCSPSMGLLLKCSRLAPDYFVLNGDKAPPAVRDSSEVARSEKQRCYPLTGSVVAGASTFSRRSREFGAWGYGLLKVRCLCGLGTSSAVCQ